MSFMNVDYDKKESKRKKYDKKNTENSNKILKLKGWKSCGWDKRAVYLDFCHE